MRILYLSLVMAIALGFSASVIAQEGEMVMVPLRERGNSGASGDATLTDNGDGTTRVRIDVEGAPPGSWPAQMGEGDCGSLGPTVFNLNSVQNGESVTDVAVALTDILAEDYYVSMDFTDPTLSPAVVCGELEAASDMPEASPTAEANAEANVDADVEATAEANVDDQRGEMPEQIPDAGSGGMAGGGLPLGSIAAVLSLAVVSGYAVLRRR